MSCGAGPCREWGSLRPRTLRHSRPRKADSVVGQVRRTPLAPRDVRLRLGLAPSPGAGACRRLGLLPLQSGDLVRRQVHAVVPAPGRSNQCGAGDREPGHREEAADPHQQRRDEHSAAVDVVGRPVGAALVHLTLQSSRGDVLAHCAETPGIGGWSTSPPADEGLQRRWSGAAPQQPARRVPDRFVPRGHSHRTMRRRLGRGSVVGSKCLILRRTVGRDGNVLRASGGRADVRAGLLRVHGHDGRAGGSGDDPLWTPHGRSVARSPGAVPGPRAAGRRHPRGAQRGDRGERSPAQRAISPARRSSSRSCTATTTTAGHPWSGTSCIETRCRSSEPDERQDPVEVRLVDHLSENDHLLGSIDDDEAVERAPGTFGERSLYPELEAPVSHRLPVASRYRMPEPSCHDSSLSGWCGPRTTRAG